MICTSCKNDVQYTVRVVQAIPDENGVEKLYDTYWCFECIQTGNDANDDSIGVSVADGKN